MGYFSGGYSLSETGPETDALLDEIAKVLFCQYGVTEYNDALTAYNAGKGLFAVYNKKTYILTDYTNSTFYFGQTTKALNYASLSLSASGWAVVDSVGVAPLNSPVFTGTPTAPTADANTNNEQIATTAYADRASYNSLMEDTASGSIASFPDGAENVPVKELTADIEPIQDLHGQASPYPPAGNKNKLVPNLTSTTINGVTFTVLEDKTIVANGTATSVTQLMNPNSGFTTLSAGSYVLSGCPTGGGDNTYSLRPMYVGGGFGADDKGSGVTLTFAEETSIYIDVIIRAGQTCNNLVFKPMICKADAPNPDYAHYEPYSNICPISGYTGAEITRTGKNLFDKAAGNELDGYINIQTHKIVDNNNAKTVYIPCKPSRTYTVSRLAGQRFIVAYTSEPPALNSTTTKGEIVNQTASSITITTGADARYLIAFVFNSSADTLTYQQILDSLQIELGSTATAYEAYNGTVYSVSWSDHGTVYKGTAEYKGDGEWEITKIPDSVDMGTLAWVAVTSAQNTFYAPIYNLAAPAKRNGFVICDRYASSTATFTTLPDKAISANADQFSTSAYVFVHDSAYSDAATFKTAVTGAQLVYELATPVTFTVSGPDPETLLGDNNIWSNTGDISVKYRCNTALYIEKKLGA